ncbi:fimbrial assembly protein PilQ [Betaproteobacteria bacterium]|nr:fimbrial assembly protein PilQ [Betaproteobacteria bacterium]GHU44137.1 fimbrial assembly protein PilQ [Betaproteobacteria bacterium]
MKHVRQILGWVVALSLGVMFPAFAGVAGAEENAITGVNVARQGTAILLKIDLKNPLDELPAEFSVSNPPRIALDFKATTNALGTNQKSIREGDFTSLDVVQVGERTRVLLNLVRSMHYAAKLEGTSSVLVTLTPLESAALVATTVPSFTQGTDSRHEIRDLTFRRGKNGEGRVIVDLSDTGTGIDIRQQGNNLVVDFLKTGLPDNLRRRLDVVDFATPVTNVVTEDKSGNVRVTITSQGQWEHNAYQMDNQFVVEVKAIVEDPNKLVQSSKLGYQGPRISINYQNGDVRALLRLMAEELGLNAVISDTVTGTTTLVLKDVPADQVVDIIFQQKGLDMRKNGNVLLIAPRDEIATREKLLYESKLQLEDLEPLVTETFQLNYHEAEAFKEILIDKERSLLSKRGSAVIDPRTNVIFIQDTPTRLEELRRIVATVDIPLRQVLIEARIVEATDQFAKNLGIRLGLLTGKAYTNAGIWAGMGGSDLRLNPESSTGGDGSYVARTSSAHMEGSLMGPAALSSGNQINLPAGSYGERAPSVFNFLLSNRQGTRLLNMEISALEADLKGRVVSSPRIMTSDQGEALIEQGVEIPYQEASSSGSTSVSFKKAVLSLKVKPHITPDGRVAMKLEINKDSRGETLAGGVAINTKKVQTSVLVENGGTVVIGGIYELTTRNDVDKVPLLGDIPILGYAFRSQSRLNEKSELLVFITPRIINENLTVGN